MAKLTPFPALVLQGSIEDKFQTLQAQRTEAELENVPDTDADGKPLTKKARAALVKAAEQVSDCGTWFALHCGFLCILQGCEVRSSRPPSRCGRSWHVSA